MARAADIWLRRLHRPMTALRQIFKFTARTRIRVRSHAQVESCGTLQGCQFNSRAMLYTLGGQEAGSEAQMQGDRRGSVARHRCVGLISCARRHLRSSCPRDLLDVTTLQDSCEILYPRAVRRREDYATPIENR